MTKAEVTVTEEEATGRKRTRLISGPGMLLVWLYGVMVVGAVSRSAVQISTEFDKAPLAYSLSAVSQASSTASSRTRSSGAARRPAGRRWCAAPPSSRVS